MKYLVLLLACCMYSCSGTNNSQHLRQVGDIPFDSTRDDPTFEPCHEDRSLVHYNFKNPDLYEGEKPAIVHAFKTLDFSQISSQSTGYITIRFMVNCEGKTGRFRVEQVDTNYKPMKFDPAMVDAILETTKSLDGWIPATYKNRTFDYYKYLTFKIVDNKIVDILP